MKFPVTIRGHEFTQAEAQEVRKNFNLATYRKRGSKRQQAKGNLLLAIADNPSLHAKCVAIEPADLAQLALAKEPDPPTSN